MTIRNEKQHWGVNMKRPLFAIGISYLTATMVVLLCSVFYTILFAGVLGVGASICLFFTKRLVRQIGITLFAAFIAVSMVFGFRHFKLEQYNLFQEQEVTVEATVLEIQRYSSNLRYLVKGTVRDTFGNEVNSSIYLSSLESQPIATGESFRCTAVVRASANEPNANSSLAKGIYLKGYISDGFKTISENKAGLEGILARFRWSIAEQIVQYLPGNSGDVVVAMTLGFDNNVDSTLMENLSRSGLIHLISISGLHVSVFMTMALGLAKYWRFRKWSSFFFSIISVLVIMALAGFKVSVIRAGIMCFFYLLGKLFRRQADSLTSLGVALLILLISNPYAAFDVGLQLSFASTASIVLFAKPIADYLQQKLEKIFRRKLDRMEKVLNILSVSLAAYLMTYPILSLQFGSVSWTAPIANLLVFWVSPVIILGGFYLGFLAALPFTVYITAGVSFVVDWTVRFLSWCAELLGGFSFSVFSTTQLFVFFGVCAILLAVALAFLLPNYRRFFRNGGLIAICLLSIGLVVSSLYHANKIEIVSMEETGAVLLIDSHTASIVGLPGDDYDAKMVVDYLKFRGITHLNCVIVGKDQKDDGYRRMIQSFTPDMVIAHQDSAIHTYSKENAKYLAPMRITFSKDVSIVINESLDAEVTIGSTKLLKLLSEYGIIANNGKLYLNGQRVDRGLSANWAQSQQDKEMAMLASYLNQNTLLIDFNGLILSNTSKSTPRFTLTPERYQAQSILFTV